MEKLGSSHKIAHQKYVVAQSIRYSTDLCAFYMSIGVICPVPFFVAEDSSYSPTEKYTPNPGRNRHLFAYSSNIYQKSLLLQVVTRSYFYRADQPLAGALRYTMALI